MIKMIVVKILILLLLLNSSPDYDYTWTKAVCEDNVCQDFLIKCSEGELVEMSAISGKVVFSDNWVDKREKKGYC